MKLNYNNNDKTKKKEQLFVSTSLCYIFNISLEATVDYYC